MNYPIKNFKTWNSAREFLSSLLANKWFFRGQGNANWNLITSFDRYKLHSDPLKLEDYLITEFKRSALHFLQPSLIPTNTLEWLALMQHYGAPTRLLDFTTSPYVAAYIAASELKEEHDRFAIWAINPAIFKSATIEKLNFQHNFDIESISHTFQENRGFDDVFIKGGYTFVYPVEPYLMNERYRLQQAKFLIAGNVHLTFEQNLLETMAAINMMDAIVKVTLPKRLKPEVLYELNSMNVNSATLFPGLDGYARLLKEHAYYFHYLR